MHRYLHNELVGYLFILSGILTVIVTRIFLFYSGYPQIGAKSGLHIAHVLFGGLLMALTLIMFFSFITTKSLMFSNAILGGIGFGLFIDEVGKFVTQDVNYFFKPAFVIMYCIFILFFIIFQLIHKKTITPREYLLNSIESLKETALHQISPDQRKTIFEYLSLSSIEPQLVSLLASYYASVPEKPLLANPFIQKLKSSTRWIASGWFFRFLTLFFIAESLILLYFVFMFSFSDRIFSLEELISLFSSIVIIILVLLGITALRTSKIKSITFFWFAVLISLTIMQLIRLYNHPLMALGWFIIDGFLLLFLHVNKKALKSQIMV